MDSTGYKTYKLHHENVDLVCNYIDNMIYFQKDMDRVFTKTYQLALKDDSKALEYMMAEIINQLTDLYDANKEIKPLYNSLNRYLNNQRSVYHEKTK